MTPAPRVGLIANYTERAVTPYGRRSPLAAVFKCHSLRPPRVSTVGIHRFRTVDMGWNQERQHPQRGGQQRHARKTGGVLRAENISAQPLHALSRHDAETKDGGAARWPTPRSQATPPGSSRRSRKSSGRRRPDRTAIDYLARHGRAADHAVLTDRYLSTTSAATSLAVIGPCGTPRSFRPRSARAARWQEHRIGPANPTPRFQQGVIPRPRCHILQNTGPPAAWVARISGRAMVATSIPSCAPFPRVPGCDRQAPLPGSPIPQRTRMVRPRATSAP